MDRKIIQCLLILYTLTGMAYTQSEIQGDLAVQFNGQYGQVEVGGPFAGAEFHHSRPLPSRISFYYPVANSLDLSTGYWERDESRPFVYSLEYSGRTDTIGWKSVPYRYTPYRAQFTEHAGMFRVEYDYRFMVSIPGIVQIVWIRNDSTAPVDVVLNAILNPTMRTSHSFITKYPDTLDFYSHEFAVIAEYRDKGTDSTALFMWRQSGGDVNSGRTSVAGNSQIIESEYSKHLNPGDELEIVNVIGTCKIAEVDSILDALSSRWKTSVSSLEKQFREYAFRDTPAIDDSALLQTYNWSRAVLATNQHYIDRDVVPMPCPAEYNFFFTHDLLLTDLGAVYFDTERVRRDLLYLNRHVRANSVLPHAYYWKDSTYSTEYCGSDNWNHLWFIILSSAYLKHSGDTETPHVLYPVLTKSLNTMLTNLGPDSLMYSMRPDWWDIGDAYGARAYITILTIQALRDYV